MTVKGTKDLVKAKKPSMLSPFEEMEKWFEEAWKRPFPFFNRSLWPTSVAELDEISPSVDIYDEEKEIVVKADLPGVKKDEVTLELNENVLTIKGEKKKEEKIERKDYYRLERSHGSFCRSFRLPENVDTDKIKANYKDGVLDVRIPKTEETKKHTKKISVE